MLSEMTPIPVGVEHGLATAQQMTDPIEFVEEPELCEGVIPRTAVVSVYKRSEGGKGLDLDVVLPPVGAEDEAIAIAEADGILPELLPPVPALVGRQLAPVKTPSRVLLLDVSHERLRSILCP